MTYRDYGPRVADTKVQVDRYLQAGDAGGDPARPPLERAMAIYVLVGRAWSASITKSVTEYSAIGRDPLVESCPAVDAAVRQIGARIKVDDFSRGFAAGATPQALWSCAAAQLAEAEGLLAEKK